jgi:hypothetical protein
LSLRPPSEYSDVVLLLSLTSERPAAGENPSSFQQGGVPRGFNMADSEMAHARHKPTVEQLAALDACAKGNSLRFENREVVDSLVEAGYATRNWGGAIQLTAVGLERLAGHAD